MSRNPHKNQNMRVYRPGMIQVGYYNNTTTVSKSNDRPAATKLESRKHNLKPIMIFIFLLAAASAFLYLKGIGKTATYLSTSATKYSSVSSNAITQQTPCSTNTDSQHIYVILSKQQLWACQYNNVAYTSAVVTGYVGNPADVTPTGTYKIYTKETKVTLTGSDGVTNWSDPVNYWMPFLFNQYGAYGIHDAPWRTPGQFGHISTNSTNASHGCIECPTATAKWIYAWAQVGTLVTIEKT